MNLATAADLCVGAAVAAVRGATKPRLQGARAKAVGPRRGTAIATATRARRVVQLAAGETEPRAALLIARGPGAAAGSAGAETRLAPSAVSNATTVVGELVVATPAAVVTLAAMAIAGTQASFVSGRADSTASNVPTADRGPRVRGLAADTSAQELHVRVVSAAVTFVVRGPGQRLATATGATTETTATGATTETTATATAETTATGVSGRTAGPTGRTLGPTGRAAGAAVISAGGRGASTASSAPTAAVAPPVTLAVPPRVLVAGGLVPTVMRAVVVARRAGPGEAGRVRRAVRAISAARAGLAAPIATGSIAVTAVAIGHRVWVRPAGARPTRAGARRRALASTAPRACGALVVVDAVARQCATRVAIGRGRARV